MFRLKPSWNGLVIDFQKKFIVKEITVVDLPNLTVMAHWLLTPPEEKLEQGRTYPNKWLESDLYAIEWTKGNIRYELFNSLIQEATQNFRALFEKG